MTLDADTKKHLGNQLIKLGDMMGDGLHHEPDGKWISAEYKKVATALGYIPKPCRKARNKAINKQMAQRVTDVKCGKCQGELKQSRSGSKRAQCTKCKARWQLLK